MGTLHPPTGGNTAIASTPSSSRVHFLTGCTLALLGTFASTLVSSQATQKALLFLNDDRNGVLEEQATSLEKTYPDLRRNTAHLRTSRVVTSARGETTPLLSYGEVLRFNDKTEGIQYRAIVDVDDYAIEQRVASQDSN